MNQRAEDVVQKRHSFALLVVSFLKAMREELHQTMRDPDMSQDDKLLARRNFFQTLLMFSSPNIYYTGIEIRSDPRTRDDGPDLCALHYTNVRSMNDTGEGGAADAYNKNHPIEV